MSEAHRGLLARLREVISETPKSGALNAGKQPYRPIRFEGAVERRSNDGAKLIGYMREKIHGAPTEGYDALVAAGRPDLTAEAVVADARAPWASLFTDADRAAADKRLGAMQIAHRMALYAAENNAVEHDREIVALVTQRRIDRGKPALTPDQEAEMMARMAAQRVGEH